MTRLRPMLCAALLLVVAGCGYTTRSLIASKYQTVYVTPFVSKIDLTNERNTGSKYKVYRPGLETDISRSLTNKFLFDGNLKPVSMGTADVVLKGELVEFRRDPLRYTAGDEVEEYRLNLVGNISLWNRQDDTLIWEEKNFVGDTTYFTQGAQAKSETTAIQDAIADLSSRIVARVVEEW
jgi:hypothetical protein